MILKNIQLSFHLFDRPSTNLKPLMLFFIIIQLCCNF